MDTKLIEDFCLGFYGYGSLDSDYWFIGMEEGGENDIQQFYENYVEKWDRNKTSDISNGINKDAELKYFSEGAKIQRTWGRLIRIILSIENVYIDREVIRNYQINKLGRNNENNLLLELLPLPNKSTSHWIFGDLDIPFLKTRHSYLQFYLPKRKECIKKLILEQKPKVVIFYSTTQQYISVWKEIIGLDCQITDDGYFVGKINDIIFSICKHPNARGITNNYFHQLGNKIRTFL